MIRFLLRFIGLLCLALGFIFLVYDGTKSIADQRWYVTKVSDVWITVQESSDRAARKPITAMGIGSAVFTNSQKFTCARGPRKFTEVNRFPFSPTCYSHCNREYLKKQKMAKMFYVRRVAAFFIIANDAG